MIFTQPASQYTCIKATDRKDATMNFAGPGFDSEGAPERVRPEKSPAQRVHREGSRPEKRNYKLFVRGNLSWGLIGQLGMICPCFFFSCHVSSSPKSMKNQLVEIGSYDLGAIR